MKLNGGDYDVVFLKKTDLPNLYEKLTVLMKRSKLKQVLEWSVKKCLLQKLMIQIKLAGLTAQKKC